jgi:hypothetical protein
MMGNLSMNRFNFGHVQRLESNMNDRVQLRSTLRLPRKIGEGAAADRAVNAPAKPVPSAAARGLSAVDNALRELLDHFLWPMVQRAFEDVEDHVEARFFQLESLQIIISRAPARTAAQPHADRRVTLEVWPGAGPRLLVVEWSGRRPYIVHRRDGDWLQRLIRMKLRSG